MKKYSVIFRSLILVLLLVLPLPLPAADTGNTAENEITFLLEYIKTSGCTFQRNGAWFTAVDAAEHINKKYLYFLKQGKITTAEDFIQYAASKSSVSGKAYTVNCRDGARIESAKWLTATLKNLRAKSGNL